MPLAAPVRPIALGAALRSATALTPNSLGRVTPRLLDGSNTSEAAEWGCGVGLPPGLPPGSTSPGPLPRFLSGRALHPIALGAALRFAPVLCGFLCTRKDLRGVVYIRAR